MRPRWFFEALGLTLLLVLPFTFPLFSYTNTVLLHNRLFFRPIILGIALDAAVLLAVILALHIGIPHLTPRFRAPVTGLLTGLMCWWLSVFTVIGIQQLPLADFFPRLYSNLDRVQVIFLRLNFTFMAFAAALAVLRPNFMSAVSRAIRLGLIAFSVSALWIVPRFIYLASLQPTRPFDRSGTLASSPPRSRIVWILMDELSHDLALERPPAGIALDDLTRFRSSSVVFSHIDPVDENTEQIVPSLLAGEHVDAVRAAPDGSVLLHEPSGEWTHFAPGASVFGAAYQRGWNPAVAGWYNPYCRTFQSVLMACFVRAGIQDLLPIQMLGASQNKSAGENALVIPRFIAGFFWTLPSAGNELQKRNVGDYSQVLQHARALVQNEKLHFVFLHLPVPHPPGLYDRTTHRLCTCGNYIDNLALADDTLALLLQDVAATPSAAQTTVIVSSDHSWRTALWRKSPFWTQEEDRLAQHFSDVRPVFLVHFPGQQREIDITGPTPELLEHDILAAMLQGSVTSPDSLVRFLSASSQPPAVKP